MPALTRSQARQLRAEGKNFQDPAHLGKKAPLDPPRISKPKRSNARIPRARPAGDAGTNTRKRRKRAGGKKRSKKNAGRRTGGRANVTAAMDATVEEERHQRPPPDEDRNVTPAATEATRSDEEPQDPLPGPGANVQPRGDDYDLADIEEDFIRAGFGSDAEGVRGDDSTRESAEQSTSGGTPPANLIPLTPDEAEAGGGLEIPNVGLPTLNNEIHDLWGDRRWRFDPQHGYGDDFHETANRPNDDQQRDLLRMLTPARRLASLWLTRPEYQGFWGTVLFGRATEDRQNRLWNLGRTVMTPARSNQLEERLEDIAARHHFIFEVPPGNPGRMALTVVIDPGVPQTWRGTEFAPGYVTYLNPDFESAVWSDAPQGTFRRWTNNTRCERLRYLFFLAVTLGGAMAELLWMDRCRRAPGNQNIRRRPRILIRRQLPYSDLTYAFQEFILGGRLMAINQRAPMALDGLALRVVRQADIVDGVVGPDSEIDVGTVRMAGIVDRLSADWWRTAGLAQTTATIPVTYARGVNDEYTLF
ncbi:MAG: hypothetical protein Q9223_007428 [Gallowayella weberi]